jgi:hypothetical protein
MSQKKPPPIPQSGGGSSIPSLHKEKQRILATSLPEAYHALGKDCVQSKRHLESVTQLVAELNVVLAELKSMREAGLDKMPVSGGEESTKPPFVITSEKRNGLIAKIGLSIFTSYGDESGPSELVQPIRNLISRLDTIANLEAQPVIAQSDPSFESLVATTSAQPEFVLDNDLENLSASQTGSWFSPQRIAITFGVVAVLFVLLMFMLSGEPPPYEQGKAYARKVIPLKKTGDTSRIRTLDAAQEKRAEKWSQEERLAFLRGFMEVMTETP